MPGMSPSGFTVTVLSRSSALVVERKSSVLAHTFCVYSPKSFRSLMRRACASAVGWPVPLVTGGSPSFSAYPPSTHTGGRRFCSTNRTTLSSVRAMCHRFHAM